MHEKWKIGRVQVAEEERLALEQQRRAESEQRLAKDLVATQQPALRLPTSDPSLGRYVLHYNPERATFTGGIAASAQKHFLGFVSTVVACLAVLLFGFCAGLGNLAIGSVFSIVLGALVMLELTRPTNLEFTPRGFRIHWLHQLFFYSGPWIDWSSVTLVSYNEASVPGIENAECFEVTFDQTNYPMAMFELMCVPITAKCEKKKFTLRFLECGFFQEDDRLNFIRALKTNVPNDRINAKLLAHEHFGEVPSYTAIWLDNLHGGRDAETGNLPDGVKLADGRFLVVKRLGSGGQAVVYDALELTGDGDELVVDDSRRGDAMHRPAQDAQVPDHSEGACNAPLRACVLKEFVLPIRGGREIKRRAIQNIQREANLLQSFDHKNIVRYRDLFIEGSRAYLVMERIFGETLRRQVEKDGKLPAEQVIVLARQMCELLEFLHSCDPPIIHRDFTPENLMHTDDGQLKLIDFNVAHRLESSSTRTVVGKHAYVPPEQFRGRPTAQSDIYALGATMYFLLTGEDPEPITRSDLSGDISVPLSLSQIVMKATEPIAAERFQSATELKEALETSVVFV